MEDSSEIIVKELHRAIVNTYKLCFEEIGYSLGATENLPEYHNYLINDPIKLNAYGLFGDPIISSGNTKENAAIVISILMQYLGLTKAQAAGIAGCLAAESGIIPNNYNKKEKDGTHPNSRATNKGGAYGASGSAWDYGAGICQWSFCNRKEKAIMDGLGVTKEQAKEIITTIGIEGLSLDKQIKMLIGELQVGICKNTLAGIKKCNSAAQAAATYYCHAVASISSSKEPATQQEIDAANKRYTGVGVNNQITKGIRLAEGFMN